MDADCSVFRFNCRRDDILSRIQKLLPCVPTTMSSSFITRSLMEVAGIFNRRDCQLAPSSKETNTALSLPANNNPFLLGSSRTVLIGSSGNPLVISVHDLPALVVL